ncbi:bifunctional copper resistance protein CopD/cytochrome c oxidase assembly protein [Nesterenkonia sp. E16_7]|uniref:cytochrome c oxidase assembly protein n=1 Tax=unclassified Nesterenkonia TaxID=2629769 RepID=UPI001A933BEF|nr:bifunctional copper resistance protein CopD/cytochrome c oxidase assembly protein [Nesterenkonia sp. E16_10]MBO0599975.1 bifunctional copper resistance protein CopD/cytochrome c oxidase assembly protein [Nesterenkonia sp. E16_7]
MKNLMRIGRPSVWWFVLGGLLAAVFATVAGLLMTGASAPSSLADPGSVVRWGTPIVTVLLNLTATVAIGAFFLCAFVLPRRRPEINAQPDTRGGIEGAESAAGSGKDPVGGAWRFAAGIGMFAVVLWVPTQLAHLVLTHLAALGTGIGSVSYMDHLMQYVTEIDAGRILVAGALIVVLASAVAVTVTGYTSAAVTLLLGVLALVPLALTGHAAGAANHELAVTAIWLHVVGVTIWAGGLAVLCLVAPRTGPTLGAVVQRYSQVALWCFVLVAVSGIVSAWIRLESVTDLVTTTYGWLLMIKIVLTLVLGVAGWWHRRVTIPAIGRHAVASQADVGSEAKPRQVRGWAFWRLAGVEVLVMGAVMGVAGALGSSAPPIPQEPAPTDSGLAFFLTGSPVPPPPTVLSYLSHWRPDLMLGLLSVAAVLVYLRWVARLRRRGEIWAPGRTASWIIGWVLFYWLTNGGPSVYGGVLFSGYALQLLIITAVVPFFLVHGAGPTLALQALPQRQDGSRGPREWILHLTRSPRVSALAHPVLLAGILGGSLLGLFFTALLDLTAGSYFARAALVVYLLLISGAFIQAVTNVTGHRQTSHLGRLLALGVILACYAVLGFGIISQAGVLSVDYFAQMGLPWMDNALSDQDLGGMIVLGVGGASIVALALRATATRRSPARAASTSHPVPVPSDRGASSD